MDLRNS